MSLNKYLFFVPNKIKVGFQKRENTSDGYLSYVIYYDEKNKLRKERSFLSWCSKEREFEDHSNDVMKGFRLASSIKRTAGHFGESKEKVRMISPLGFEFEVNVENFIYLLEHGDIISLEYTQECRFVWDQKGEMFLLPTNSVEYKEAINKMNKKSNVLKAEELVVGQAYSSKKEKNVVYIYLGDDLNILPRYADSLRSEKQNGNILDIEGVFENLEKKHNSILNGEYVDYVYSNNKEKNYEKNSQFFSYSIVAKKAQDLFFIKKYKNSMYRSVISMGDTKDLEEAIFDSEWSSENIEKLKQTTPYTLVQKVENVEIKDREMFENLTKMNKDIFIQSNNEGRYIILSHNYIYLLESFKNRDYMLTSDTSKVMNKLDKFKFNSDDLPMWVKNKIRGSRHLLNYHDFKDEFFGSQKIFCVKLTLSTGESFYL